MAGVRTGSSGRYCRSCYHAASLVCRRRLKADSYRSPRGQQPAAGRYKRTAGRRSTIYSKRMALAGPGSWRPRAGRPLRRRPARRGHRFLTSIAWRIAHLAACAEVYRNWTFEDQRLGLRQFAVPGTRDALNEWVHSAQDRLTRSVDGLD